ncbi:MAG: DNA translocase FtsK 4TM domain-containing protein, partial [Clostridia bacterium]|nr:DNA translocase FtsK 4TM domain-containing protein [Clostridia bacterium]
MAQQEQKGKREKPAEATPKTTTKTQKSGGGRSAPKQGGGAKAAAARAEQQRQAAFRRLAKAVTEILLGVFFLACMIAGIFFPDKPIGGALGKLIQRLLLGCLGSPGVLMPVTLIFAGVLNGFGRKDRSYNLRKGAGYLIALILSTLMALFAAPVEGTGWSVVGALFEQGNAALLSGGVAGGLLSRALLALLGQFGTLMLCLAALLFSLAVVWGVTAEGILEKLFPERQAKKEARQEKKEAKAERREEKRIEKEQRARERRWEKELEAEQKLRRHKPGDLSLGEDKQPPEPEPQPEGALPMPPTFMPRRPRAGQPAALPEAVPQPAAPVVTATAEPVTEAPSAPLSAQPAAAEAAVPTAAAPSPAPAEAAATVADAAATAA